MQTNIVKTVMTEKNTQPYNIKEKQEKNAAYRSLIRAELADELYEKILNMIVIEKRYRNKDFSAKELAKEFICYDLANKQQLMPTIPQTNLYTLKSAFP